MISLRGHERELLSSPATNNNNNIIINNPVHTIIGMHEQLYSLVNPEKDYDKEKILKAMKSIIKQTIKALPQTIQAEVGYALL